MVEIGLVEILGRGKNKKVKVRRISTSIDPELTEDFAKMMEEDNLESS